jgi:hypothetical protein
MLDAQTQIVALDVVEHQMSVTPRSRANLSRRITMLFEEAFSVNSEVQDAPADANM